MTFIPVVNVVKVELICTAAGQTIENVLYFQEAAGVSVSKMNELGAFLVSWWGTNIKPNVPTTQSLIQIKLTDMDSATGSVVNYATGLPVVGTNAGASLPSNAALVITKRTALRGRSYRGRYYHGLLPSPSVTGNTVSGALTSGLVTSLNLLRTFTTTGGSWTLGVASFVHNGVITNPGVFNAVVSHDSDGIVDSQRRRLPKRGN